MTVGVPEINLDTWGLRYVKKKEVENKSPAETKPDQFLRDDDADTSNPNTRQQDTAGDTTTRRGATGGKTGEQVHQHQQDKTRLGGQKGETFATSGSKRGEGATDTPTRAGQALDAKGQVKHEQTHTGSEGRNIATDPITHRGGHKIKPDKQGEGSSTKPKGSVQSTQSGKDKEPAPKGGTGSAGIQSTQTGADPKTPKAKPTGDIPDKVGRHITDVGTTTATPTSGGSPKIKAILDLAIIKCKLLKMNNVNKILPLLAAGAGRAVSGAASSLGNAAADVGNKLNSPDEEVEKSEEQWEGNPDQVKRTDKQIKDKKLDNVYRSDDIVDKAIELINEAYDEMKKSNPVIVSDPKGKPFCSNCGRDHGKEDAKALEGTDDQQQRMVSGTRGGNKPSCPSCGHRPNKKAEGSTSTGDVGAANFVYSDVKEAKKQESKEEKPCKHCSVGHKDGKSLGLGGDKAFHDRGHKNKPDAKRSGELY